MKEPASFWADFVCLPELLQLVTQLLMPKISRMRRTRPTSSTARPLLLRPSRESRPPRRREPLKLLRSKPMRELLCTFRPASWPLMVR